ncbi:putative toxin-antitoxin system toxin component, PIN family [Methylococcus sp. ANG]|uniref:putative toxin-antitoxin system toxin component, PIN family n=1 Tax=Methylococcus sp. ANG TaxID=3231903 RepID=UPI0034594EB3
MKVFLDTNVWASAFGSRGICQDLLELLLGEPGVRAFRLLTCEQVKAETLRTLRDKFRVSSAGLAAATAVLADVEAVDVFNCPPLPAGFPDADDWPILCAAIAARADMIVTGDKALLALEAIEGLPIVDPRTAYLRLRGLA